MRKSASKSKISNEAKGCLVILSAPSGCGKTTIATRLLTRHPDWLRSVSVTTRPPRPEEKSGEDYEFVRPRQFASLKQRKAFLESVCIFDHYYGTRRRPLKENLKQGKTVMLTVDIQGHRRIRKAVGKKTDAYSIFVLPPSMAVLRERLEKRSTDSQEAIEERIQRAEEEVKVAKEYDATVINHDLDQTVRDIEALIHEFQKKSKRRQTDGLSTA